MSSTTSIDRGLGTVRNGDRAAMWASNTHRTAAARTVGEYSGPEKVPKSRNGVFPARAASCQGGQGR
jgi:hypothetical protein